MKIYYPELWKIVKITSGNDEWFKVLAEFGVRNPNNGTCKVSSKIIRVEENTRAFEVVISDGSVYVCKKGDEKFGDITKKVFSAYSSKLKENGNALIYNSTINKLKKSIDVDFI